MPPQTWTFLALSVSLLSIQDTWADTFVQNSRTVDVTLSTSQMRKAEDADQQQNLAQDWGLQKDDWVRYRKLMQGPLGIYSPGLDPLTALGIEARTQQERRRFAELQVRMEARRTENILAYQRAYDDAWRRLYPTLQPVNFSTPEVSAGDSGVGRLGRRLIFVKDSCPPCEQRVRELQAEGAAMDIYMVGSLGEDSRIRRWAAQVGIDPAKVRNHLITLNHDGGRWLKFGGQGELPAVFSERQGQWQHE